jgi:two-component system chemotaxis response regulator CheY
MYKKLKPDLVLMDIAMPKKHGIDAIREIRSMDPKARIIAVTALYSPEKRNAALEAGAAAVVSKPIDIPELIRTIESLLQNI